MTHDSEAIRWLGSDKMAAMFTGMWSYRIKMNFNIVTFIPLKTPTITIWTMIYSFHFFIKVSFIAWQKTDSELIRTEYVTKPWYNSLSNFLS